MRLRELGFASLLAAAACTRAADVGSSEDNHTGRNPTWSNSPYQWVELAPGDLGDADTSIESTDPVAVRLQAWIERFDAVVRRIVRETTGEELAAPKPRVRLVVNTIPNAFVKAMPTCVAVSAVNGPDFPVGVYSTLSYVYDGTSCIEPTHWPAAPAPLEWLNGLGGIQARQDSDGFHVPVPGLGGKTHDTTYGKLAVYATGSLISIQTGLIDALPEKGAAVVIAHELAHYYRAHGALGVRDRYGYWFERRPNSHERVPLPDQTKYERGYELAQADRFAIEGQKYHSRIASTLLKWFTAIDAVSGHVCEAAVREYRSWPPSVFEELTEISNDALGDDAKAAFLRFERALPECIGAIELNADRAPDTTLVIEQDSRAPREFFLNRFSSFLRRYIVPDEELTSVATFGSLIRHLTARVEELDAEGAAFMPFLEENRVGLFSHEQEADELAMELSTQLGIEPSEVLDAFALLQRVREDGRPDARPVHANLSARECAALRARDFRDKSGREVYVPMSTTPHHTDCYRIYNLHRENEAHRWNAAAPNMPIPTPPWSELQEHARALQSPR